PGGTLTGIAFFFQAEDGIRDFHVTGVQTCALPILPTKNIGRFSLFAIGGKSNIDLLGSDVDTSSTDLYSEISQNIYNSAKMGARSEERRVGKQARSRCEWMH